MFPPFPQESARHYTQELISDINDGLILLKQINQISLERADNGIMLGSLVCYIKNKGDRVNCSTKSEYNGDRVILHSVSGISKQLQINYDQNTDRYIKNGILHIIVPSIVSNDEINKALQENDAQIHELTKLINSGKKEFIKKRSELCDISLRRVFNLYNFTRFDGKQITLNEIIQDRNMLPPTGTGDCCEPKLLSYAFSHNLQPLSMDEIYYGKSSTTKINGKSYAPCDERCGILLPYILGLNIVYQDKDLAVINKQSELLSVPGKGENKRDSAESRFLYLYPDAPKQNAVHRLDMETSGLMILAKTKKAHSDLRIQFEKNIVQKKYEALLDGVIEKSSGLYSPKKGETSGVIELKFRLDPEHRPYQIYDEINGKPGITEWEKINTQNYITADGKKHIATRLTYIPHTGRTHQLRLVSSDSHGFGCPIIGDRLYGSKIEKQSLLLHAKEITFQSPSSKCKITVYSEAEF